MRIFDGIKSDFRRRYPFYKSDFINLKDGKVVSATFYLFFACLANAIAFGSLSELLTEGEIGVIEMLLATAVGGIFYALLSAQPIILLGGTGPIVIFTSLLFGVCREYNINFISVYGWCGVWTGIILIIFAITNVSNLMRFFSRFTDDIFAALVSIIFIFEAIKNLTKGFFQINILFDGIFLSVLLAIGTFVISFFLKNIKFFSNGLSHWMNILSDFGPTIAIVSMTLVAFMLDTGSLERPNIPNTLDSTTSGRYWLVNFSEIPDWIKLISIVPAFFAAILLYLDQNITSHIINEGEIPLVKGHGYHLDLMLVGCMTLAFSFFGLPWIVAATVHSVNHLRSLSLEKGDSKTSFIVVIETRVSAFFIHLAMGVVLFLLSWIELIPMSVLFGLFIYMGVVSLQGNLFFVRALSLFFPFMGRFYSLGENKVSKKGRNQFTIIQVLCFSLLWLVKSSVLGILFPIFIATCVPIRMFLSLFIKKSDLTLLDNYKY